MSDSARWQELRRAFAVSSPAWSHSSGGGFDPAPGLIRLSGVLAGYPMSTTVVSVDNDARFPHHDPLTGLLRPWVVANVNADGTLRSFDDPAGNSGLGLRPNGEVEPLSADIAAAFRPDDGAPWLAAMPVGTVFILADLLGLKLINDRAGMATGDRVLREQAQRFRRGTSPWPAFRAGGDEFLAAAPSATEEDLNRVLAELRAAMARPIDGHEVSVTIAVARGAQGESPYELFVGVSAALDAARQRGRGNLGRTP